MEDLMKKVARLVLTLSHKSFLLLTKYIPHLMAFMYFLYTILGFCGIDSYIISYISSMSLLPLCYIFVNSFIFRYCYVHRLPLYYIILNDGVTILDNYKHIQITDFQLVIYHILLFGIIMFGYTLYYIQKKRLKYH